ncbi:unnamed protein product [Mesocestoides corti]|uniref:PAM2 domain-containing protein n=1 Tax=Mesocestoides corti TaxID=53468 RepID=A0A0R3U955_MESCO|nr:unnamed protein product [Mesocestoides corti]
MSSDPNSMSGLGVRFSAAESDDQDYARAHNSSEESEHPTKVGAFANFFEEFEQESDGMSQYSQPNRNWQQAMLHSFDHENVHEITDSSDVFNQHNFPSPYMHDVDPDLVYMDRYGELSQPVNPFTSYGEVGRDL